MVRQSVLLSHHVPTYPNLLQYYTLLLTCCTFLVNAQQLTPYLDHDVIFRRSSHYQDYSHTARIAIALQFEQAHADVSTQKQLIKLLPAFTSAADVTTPALLPDHDDSATELNDRFDRAAAMFGYDHATSSSNAATTLEAISNGIIRVLQGNTRRRRSPPPSPVQLNTTAGDHPPFPPPVPLQRHRRTDSLPPVLSPYTDIAEKDKEYYWSTITDRTQLFLLPDDANVYKPYLTYTTDFITNLQAVIDKNNRTAIKTMIQETASHLSMNNMRRMDRFLDMSINAYNGKPDVSALNTNVVTTGLQHYNTQLSELFGLTLATTSSYQLAKFPFRLLAHSGSYYLVFTVPVVQSPQSHEILVPSKTSFQLSTLTSTISLTPQLGDDILISGDPARPTTMSHLLSNCFAVENKFYCRDSSTRYEPASCLAALYGAATGRILSSCQFIVSSLAPFVTRISGTQFIYSSLTSHSFSRDCPDSKSLLSIPSGTTLVDLQNCSALHGPDLSMKHLINAAAPPINKTIDVNKILSHVTEGRDIDAIFADLQQATPHFGRLSEFRTLSTSDLLFPDINDVDTLLTSFLITLFVYTMSHVLSCVCNKNAASDSGPLIAPPRTRRT